MYKYNVIHFNNILFGIIIIDICSTLFRREYYYAREYHLKSTILLFITQVVLLYT